MFGVTYLSIFFLAMTTDMKTDIMTAISQDERVYVTDARALHHILVKDQYEYEVTPMVREYAYIR